MEMFLINGGKSLSGDVVIDGAKNAAVAIIPAVLLSDEPCTLDNIPDISDVSDMFEIMRGMGAVIEKTGESSYTIDATKVNTTEILSEIAGKMRASYYFMGALLGRSGKVTVAMPGGCFFGVRPIDQHLKGFDLMGATNSMIDGGDAITFSAKHLVGARIYMDVVSVGATINVMLAAVKADGTTIIENAAREPHIVDLANFLNSMGANIKGAGTDVIKIKGVDRLHGTSYAIIPDQIEAGTYLMAVAATRGKATIKNVTPKHLESITAKLREMNVKIEEYDDSVYIDATGDLKRCNIKTMAHPGFPTDMQPQAVALLSTVEGTSFVTEAVWENRFQYIGELQKMGASISLNSTGDSVIIDGVKQLNSATLVATDLRAGAAMVIAALCANGSSTVSEIRYIERGYRDIVGKLRNMGADISRIDA